VDAVDVVAIAGLVMLVAGIALIYRPAALIVLGALLLFYAFVISAKPKAQAGPREES
jgi:hypothetical protein